MLAASVATSQSGRRQSAASAISTPAPATTAAAGATRDRAAQRLCEREQHGQHPRHGAARGGPPEEDERVALRIARQLPGEEEEHMLVHQVVPREAGVP